MHDARFTTLVGGLVFPEGLRWRRDRLWFTDVEARRVYCCDTNGIVLVAFETVQHPVGLGWDSAGTLMISTLEQRLLRYVGGAVDDGIDLAGHVPHNGNDLVVDGRGRAYYGSVGAPMQQPTEFNGAGTVVLVDGDRVRTAADGLSFPNGMVLTPDGATLIVSESVGRCLTKFAVAADGSLADRAVFAALDTIPDGICLDAEGAVWVACPTTTEVQRVREGGEVLERIDTGRTVLDVELGGDDGHTLYAATAPDISHTRAGEGPHTGKIEQLRVDVPGPHVA
ncbi:MAG: SMP-30/gluconolactonase/LRE family protein [Acidimicrobiales bacterium]